VPAGGGKAVRLRRGQQVKLVNTLGSQVVDTWAFRTDDPTEFMSMEHSRSTLEKLMPQVGDSMASNRRRPMLTVVEDTSPGVHDMLLSACDTERYRLLGHEGYHANCVDNLKAALAAVGVEPPEIPSPWNVFEHVAITRDNRLEIRSPLVQAGQYLLLRAEMDQVVIFSACPMDIVDTNGPDHTPKEVHYQVLDGDWAESEPTGEVR
jgi:uncharacterized protein YcgI (DUF1989 family)